MADVFSLFQPGIKDYLDWRKSIQRWKELQAQFEIMQRAYEEYPQRIKDYEAELRELETQIARIESMLSKPLPPQQRQDLEDKGEGLRKESDYISSQINTMKEEVPWLKIAEKVQKLAAIQWNIDRHLEKLIDNAAQIQKELLEKTPRSDTEARNEIKHFAEEATREAIRSIRTHRPSYIGDWLATKNNGKRLATTEFGKEWIRLYRPDARMLENESKRFDKDAAQIHKLKALELSLDDKWDTSIALLRACRSKCKKSFR